MSSELLLHLEKVTKTFPGVTALDSVDFDVRSGEVMALVGENGAGKSTLIKLLGGMYQPDAGTITYEGREVVFNSTVQSRENNIAVIYQEFNLVPDLSVAENIFLGMEPTTLGFINWRKLNEDAGKILKRLDSDIDVVRYIADLTVAERQMVEIARALSFESKLIIMDEPTATLTDREVRKLFEIVKKLKDDGVSIIYISHRLEEAFELSDRITVLRDGKKVGTVLTKDTFKNEIIEMMVGKVVKDYFLLTEKNAVNGDVVLEVKDYSIADAVESVNFCLKRGEILALAGVIGSGVQQLLQSLYGVTPKKTGEVFFEGQPVSISSPKDAIALGIGYVTEDRKETGILPDMSVLHNLSIIIIKKLREGLFINNRKETERFTGIREKLDIKLADKNQKIIYLSGGNQQKAVICRTLLADCKVLILLEPTRGIDVNAKAEIHRILRELANRGMSIIFTSSELPELVNLPDRCLVFYRGVKTAEFNRETMDENELVAAQIGHRQ
ncbi:MAG: sugar ABC transporter ATP-binding protein [Spirochaetales bacterium]|nr:MAG: sugar ABC transporter ATP-binding protein [Spirochaetales bacterium]